MSCEMNPLLSVLLCQFWQSSWKEDTEMNHTTTTDLLGVLQLLQMLLFTNRKGAKPIFCC